MKSPTSRNSLTIILGLTALSAAMPACTNHASDRADNVVTSDERDVRRDHDRNETYQAPGTLDTMKKDTGRATVEVRKQTTKTETEKQTIPTVEEKHVKADINRMSADDFHKLGLSRGAAENIVQWRHDHGNFQSLDDLRKVPGVNTAWLSGMRNQLGFSSG